MNQSPLNDPDLQSLEARLAAAPPQLANREYQRLLYQCAFAAGQSDARRAGARSRRGWMGATSLLAVLSLALGLHQVRLMSNAGPDRSEAGLLAERRSDVLTTRSPGIEGDAPDLPQLSVSTSLDHVVDFNWPPQPLATESSVAPPTDPTPAVLTPLSRIEPDIHIN